MLRRGCCHHGRGSSGEARAGGYGQPERAGLPMVPSPLLDCAIL